MATNPVRVIAGIDTHADTHHVGVINEQGRRLGDAEFPATGRGYIAACKFIGGFGSVVAVGIECTGSYGAGITRHLRAREVLVIEVTGGMSPARRSKGKTDALDSYRAAEAVLSGCAAAAPKARDGIVESLRVMRIARNSAVKARTAAMNQITALLVSCDEQLRVEYRAMTGPKLVRALAASRPAGDIRTSSIATAYTLRALALRCESLSTEIAHYSRAIDQLTLQANPALRAMKGVGPEVAAQLLITAGDNHSRIRTESKLAALAGVAPIPASSGKITRHRLSRGGDRAANYAIHVIAMSRMNTDQRTIAYAERRRSQGKSEREIMRCLKRYIVREVFHAINHPHDVPALDLRPARKAAGLTMTAVAKALDVELNKLSRLERAVETHPEIELRYREWLAANTQQLAA